MKTINLYTDGGARGNPGPAAIGAVAFDAQDVVFEISRCIGESTNNQAEYLALLEGLKECVNQKITKVDCFLDSELIVKQMNGEYKVKDIKLKPLHNEVIDLSKKFISITYTHIPRAKNKQADALVNKALDARK